VPKFIVTAPNGKKYNVDGPEGSTQDDAISFVRQQLGDVEEPEQEEGPSALERLLANYKPDRSLGEAASAGVSRGMARLGSTITDVIPAFLGSAVGADEYARAQMEEAAKKEELLQKTNPAQFGSFRDVQGIGDAFTYLAELGGEQLPNILTSVGTGGASGIAANVAAKTAARKAITEPAIQRAKERLAKKVTAEYGPQAVAPKAMEDAAQAQMLRRAERLVTSAGRDATGKGILAGAGVASVGLNVPEIFQNIYEETGQLEPTLAALFGSIAGALDTILPAQFLKTFQSNPALKKAVAEKIAERKGLIPAALKGAGKAAGMEGLTEAAQEALSITAEQIADKAQNYWGQKEFDRVLESFVAGAVIGGPLGGISGTMEAARNRPIPPPTPPTPPEQPPEATGPAPVPPTPAGPPRPAEEGDIGVAPFVTAPAKPTTKEEILAKIPTITTVEELNALSQELNNMEGISGSSITSLRTEINKRRNQVKKDISAANAATKAAEKAADALTKAEARVKAAQAKNDKKELDRANKEVERLKKQQDAAAAKAEQDRIELAKKLQIDRDIAEFNRNFREWMALPENKEKLLGKSADQVSTLYKRFLKKQALDAGKPAAEVETAATDVTAPIEAPPVAETPAVDEEVETEATAETPPVSEEVETEATDVTPAVDEEVETEAAAETPPVAVTPAVTPAKPVDPNVAERDVLIEERDAIDNLIKDTVNSVDSKVVKDILKRVPAWELENMLIERSGVKNPSEYVPAGVGVLVRQVKDLQTNLWDLDDKIKELNSKISVEEPPKPKKGRKAKKDEDSEYFSKTKEGKALAAFVPSERLAVYSPGLSEQERRALRAHEVGAHYAIGRMLGKEAYADKLRELRALRGKSKMVDTAYEMVPADTPSYLVDHEALGYLVENYERLPLVKRLLQAVRDWWNKTFKGETLTPTDLRDMVRAAMLKHGTDVREEFLTEGTVEDRVAAYGDAQFSVGQRYLANSTDLASNSSYLYDRISNAMDTNIAKLPTWGQGVANRIVDFIEKGPVLGTGRLLTGLLDMRGLAEVASTRNPELGSAIREVEKTVGLRDNDMSKGREKVERFLKDALDTIKGVTPEQRDKFGYIVNESTIRQVDPTTDRTHFLAAQYDSLPKSLRDLYVKLRDEYGEFVKEYTDLLNKEEVLGPASKVLADLLSRGIKPYFPLHRRGEFWLQYIDPISKEEGVSAFETPRERREFIRFLRGKGVDAKDIVEFARISNITTESLPPTSQFRKVLQTLRSNEKISQDTIDEVYRMYLDLFPNSSIMQQFQPRKGTPGYIKDPLTAYADVGTRMAMNLAQFKSMKAIDEALDKAKGVAGARATDFDATIVASLVGRERYLKSPIQKGLTGAVASFAGYNSYRWFIMGNMSSALINLTQSFIQFGMLAGKYGPAKAFRAMRDANSLYFRGGRDTNTSIENPFTGKPMNDLTFGGANSNLTADEQALYDIAVARGAIRRSTGQDLMQMREKGVDDPTSKWVQTQTWLGWMFQNTERYNREIGLLAAYKLAREQGVPHERAVDQAIDAVGEVHGSAMAELGPEFFQSGIGKIVGTFKRFAMSQVYLQYKLMRDMFKGASPEIKREAAKQYLAVNGVVWTFAGLKGMPVYGLANLATSILNWMFGDEDEPFDLDEVMRANLGNAIFTGPLGTALGADLSSRAGFSDLLWRPDPKRVSEVGLGTYIMEQLGGPAFGIIKSMQEGIKHADRGDYYRALEAFSPSALRNIEKGFRYATEGAVNSKGFPITQDLSGFDSLKQALGLTPNELAEIYAKNNAATAQERRIETKRKSLLQRSNLARYHRDFDELREIRQEISEFNRSRFGRLVPIVFGEDGTLEKSWRAWNQQLDASVNGVVLNPKLAKEIMKKVEGGN